MVKNLPADARETGLIPGSERSSGEGKGYPPQYSSLENSMDREEPDGLCFTKLQKVRHN